VFVAEKSATNLSFHHPPEQLASWAGLTPKPHESDIHLVHRGGSSKQGSTLFRWAAVDAVAALHLRIPGWGRSGTASVIGRWPCNIGFVAAARWLITRVF